MSDYLKRLVWFPGFEYVVLCFRLHCVKFSISQLLQNEQFNNWILQTINQYCKCWGRKALKNSENDTLIGIRGHNFAISVLDLYRCGISLFSVSVSSFIEGEGRLLKFLLALMLYYSVKNHFEFHIQQRPCHNLDRSSSSQEWNLQVHGHRKLNERIHFVFPKKPLINSISLCAIKGFHEYHRKWIPGRKIGISQRPLFLVCS